MRHLVAGFIRLWRRLVSPLYGDVCRYHPSCSAYGLEAVQVHGAVKGSALAVWRILRCNPWSPGGYDPVPGTPAAHAWQAEQAAARQPSPTDLPESVLSGASHDTRGEI